MAAHRRFGDLIRATPALRAYRSEVMDRFVDVAADALARRRGGPAGDPRDEAAAAALLGLWRVQFGSLRTHVDGTASPSAVHRAVSADVDRAARLVEGGLREL
jgi:hypothetical protein